MSLTISKTQLLLTLKKEISKDHLEYDGFGRVSKMYLAISPAVTGDICLVKEFIYEGGTANVRGRKEGYAVWDSAWDNPPLNPDFLVDDIMNQLTDDMGNALVEY